MGLRYLDAPVSGGTLGAEQGTPRVQAMIRQLLDDVAKGELEVVTLAGSGKARDSPTDLVERVPFLMLGALAPAPCWSFAAQCSYLPVAPTL